MTPPALSFSHMGFFVHDLPRMEDFYRRVLGFTVTDRGQLDTPSHRVDLVFLSRDPREHHQIVLANGRPAEMSFNVINQISFRAESLQDLKRLHMVVRAEVDLSEIRAVTHGNAISTYFRDPEGNRVELFMDTPWYCIQPVREPVDLSRTDDEIMADTQRIAAAAKNYMGREAWVEKMRSNMAAGIHA